MGYDASITGGIPNAKIICAFRQDEHFLDDVEHLYTSKKYSGVVSITYRNNSTQYFRIPPFLVSRCIKDQLSSGSIAVRDVINRIKSTRKNRLQGIIDVPIEEQENAESVFEEVCPKDVIYYRVPGAPNGHIRFALDVLMRKN